MLDYEQPENSDRYYSYELEDGPALVLSLRHGSHEVAWNELLTIWDLLEFRVALVDYLNERISVVLDSMQLSVPASEPPAGEEW